MDDDLDSTDDIQLSSLISGKRAPRHPDEDTAGDDVIRRIAIHRPLELETSSSLDIKLEKGRRPRFNRFIKLFVALAAALLIIASLIWRVLPVNREQDNTAGGTMDSSKKDTVEDEPNPPILPDSIHIFYPPKTEPEIEALNAELSKFSDPIVTKEDFFRKTTLPPPPNYPDFTYTSDLHFTSKRTALLFAPGVYEGIDFEVAYYTSVLGLGAKPTDVTFTNCDKGPHVDAINKFTTRPPWGSGLDTFWRSVENIATNAREGMRWAASQAAPLRRVHVQSDLLLFDGDAWASGGVLANAIVDGQVNFGGQQQYLLRNVELKRVAVNGAWSLVFVGCTGETPLENSGFKSGPSISVDNSPKLRIEKPFITMKESGEFELRVPLAAFSQSHGHNDVLGSQFGGEQVRSFTGVKLGVPSTDGADNYLILQKALDEGKDLVLSPGVYPLAASLEVKYPNQVILGLGYATLKAPLNGSPCILVHPKVPGVRIAGIMLEASVLTGTIPSSSLLQWGMPDVDDVGDSKNPGLLSDVFCRVGGASYDRHVSTEVMIQLYSGNIYGDNLWLWRADHVKLHPGEEANFPHISPYYRQTVMGECQVRNGMKVYGQAVTMVGLFIEHTTEDQLIWEGDNGYVAFYQCELPYDVDQSYADKSFVGYRIGPDVKSHTARGTGIYSNFRDFDVNVATAISHPESDGIVMSNLFTVYLDNQGKINSVVNGKGPSAVSESDRGRPFRCSDNACLDDIGS
mmetsp:Transcript_24460/g.37418  ORF Transcript_24460/g.37418 Transcript_24460/m.37418 type:complete len:742 (-) Transcript_24460:31-2256(-)